MITPICVLGVVAAEEVAIYLEIYLRYYWKHCTMECSPCYVFFLGEFYLREEEEEEEEEGRF